MVRRLAAAGHDVTVWNRTAATAQEVAASTGSIAAPSAAAAVRDVDVVISMLASGSITAAVLLDDEVVSALRSGVIVCDMATSGVAVARELDAALTDHGVRFVDAPVSGSVPTIEAGQLLVMASGSRSGADDVESILAAFAKRVVFVGDAGAGQAMKLAVNLVVHTLNSAVSEALTLATSAGVTPEAAYDIFEDSVVAAPFVHYKRPAFLDPATPVAMSLSLTEKDLQLITAFAADQGVSTTVADAVRDEVAQAVLAGMGDQDMAALARFLRGVGPT